MENKKAPLVLESGDFWRRTLPFEVFKMFASIKNAINVYAEEGRRIDLELEARLGQFRDNRYFPGVQENLFQQMKQYYHPSKIDQPTIETYDIIFSDSRIRVSVEIRNNEALIGEVIQKFKDSFPNINQPVHGKRIQFDLRVSLMVERHVDEQESDKERKFALEWIEKNLKIFPNRSFIDKQILEGKICKILKDDFRILRHSAFVEETSPTWWQELDWVLVSPLPSFNGLSISTLYASNNSGNGCQVKIGNLCHFNLPVAAFEIQLEIDIRNLQPLHDERNQFNTRDFNPNIFVRHKKRWKSSFDSKKKLNGTLDLTETREGNSLESLTHASKKFEVEFERTFTLDRSEMKNSFSWDPFKEAIDFLTLISNVGFSSSLPPVPSDLDSKWKQVKIENLSLNGVQPGRPPQQVFHPPAEQQEHYPNKRLKEDLDVHEQYEKIKDLDMQSTLNLEEEENLDNKIATTLTSDFYNQLDRDRNTRHKSLIFHMRCLNNFVKSLLLQTYMRKLDNKNVRVLELSCGKGGDLGKLVQVNGVRIVKYVGTDIAQKSLESAIERLQSIKKPIHDFKLVCADLSTADLHLDNWGSESGLPVWTRKSPNWFNTTEVLRCDERFNFVTMQFALHYMFSSPTSLSTFFKGIAFRMTPGSFFVCTTIDSDAVLSELLNSPNQTEINLSDDRDRVICTIKFEKEAIDKLLNSEKTEAGLEEEEKSNAWVGLQYHFTLFDEADKGVNAVNAPEWLVTTPTLKYYADLNNLEIVERCRLGDFVTKNLDTDQEDIKLQWKRMNVPNYSGSVSDIEWKVANLYQVLVFQKKIPDYEQESFVLEMIKMQSEDPGWDQLSAQEKNERVLIALEKN